jgi:hypothetical protein
VAHLSPTTSLGCSRSPPGSLLTVM